MVLKRWQLLFQEAATKIMDNIIGLHHDIMFFLVLISTFAFYMLIRIVLAFRIENTETVRTLTLQHHTLIFHNGFSPSLMLLFSAGLIRIIITNTINIHANTIIILILIFHHTLFSPSTNMSLGSV